MILVEKKEGYNIDSCYFQLLKNGHVRKDLTKITTLQECYAHYKHFAIKQTQTVAISKKRFLLWFETFSKQRTNKGELKS